MPSEGEQGIMIIPAIMPGDLVALREQSAALALFASCAQIDVMDGTFVQARSWPCGEGHYAELERQCREGIRPLYSDDFSYEDHLMVQHPAALGELLARAGASRIIAHAEALAGSVVPTDAIAGWRAAGASEIGIAARIGTSLDVLESYAEAIDMIQIMGIEQIGLQGQPFDERAVMRVQEAHARFPHLPIAVDGGVNQETIGMLARAGATRFVVGSAISTAPDPGAAYAALRRAAVDNAIGDSQVTR